MPASEKTTWRGRLRAFQLDSLCTVTESRTVVSVVVTARLGMALNGGEGDDRGELGFRLGRILGAGRKNSRARVRCGPLYGARMRLVTSTVEEKLPPASRSRARLRAVTPARGEDEDDFVPRYLDEGVWAVVAGLVLGCLWAACWAVCWAARPGEAGKSPLLYFFPLFFSIL
jgi:hypothetical protein